MLKSTSQDELKKANLKALRIIQKTWKFKEGRVTICLKWNLLIYFIFH
jgi:hypothetical protein